MALPSSTSAVLGRLLGFVGVYIEKKVMYKDESILTRCPITQGQWIHIITSKIHIIID